METIQIIPNTAAMQLKYNYAQLDSTTAIMTRGAAVEVALEKLDLYGRLTGHFTDIPPAQRILEKIIKNLQDNLTK